MTFISQIMVFFMSNLTVIVSAILGLGKNENLRRLQLGEIYFVDQYVPEEPKLSEKALLTFVFNPLEKMTLTGLLGPV